MLTLILQCIGIAIVLIKRSTLILTLIFHHKCDSTKTQTTNTIIHILIMILTFILTLTPTLVLTLTPNSHTEAKTNTYTTHKHDSYHTNMYTY